MEHCSLLAVLSIWALLCLLNERNGEVFFSGDVRPWIMAGREAFLGSQCWAPERGKSWRWKAFPEVGSMYVNYWRIPLWLLINDLCSPRAGAPTDTTLCLSLQGTKPRVSSASLSTPGRLRIMLKILKNEGWWFLHRVVLYGRNRAPLNKVEQLEGC